ncbi:zinc-binding dehydrogenase [Methylibium petroleiphilum]
MAIGTAGYTAMLCVLALEQHGVRPDRGPVLVTGAAGGVGTIAIAVLAKLGFDVTASTGRLEEAAFLQKLGASQVIDRATLASAGEMLGEEKWAGAIDTVGSATLANVCAATRYRGTVTACGLAQGLDFPTSVLPFILRNITLCGIDSVMAPYELRAEAWQRLARDLDVKKLDAVTQVLGLDQAIATANDVLSGNPPTQEVNQWLLNRIPPRTAPTSRPIPSRRSIESSALRNSSTPCCVASQEKDGNVSAAGAARCSTNCSGPRQAWRETCGLRSKRITFGCQFYQLA